MCSVESSPTLTGCTFQDNEAGLQGGAMFGEDSNSVWVDCTFHANWSGDGGAVCNSRGQRLAGHRLPLPRQCRSRPGRGHLRRRPEPGVTNCLFSGNLGVG